MLRNYTATVCLLLCAGVATSGCHDLITVDDPTAILDSQVNNAEGAEMLRLSIYQSLSYTVAAGAWESGLLADEFRFQQDPYWNNQPFPYDGPDLLDRRAGPAEQAQAPNRIGTNYPQWQTVRASWVPTVLEKLSAYARPGAREAHMAETFTIRAYVAMRLAENYCPGFPLHEVKDFKRFYDTPKSTQEVFEYALANYDSAITLGKDSARVLNFARVGRARTLLQLGRFAEAAAAASAVPTSYSYVLEYRDRGNYSGNILSASYPLWGTMTGSMVNAEGGNGLDFISANDPRVLWTLVGTARDGTTQFYAPNKYPLTSTPFRLATGLEARLIEAEAALHSGDSNWLTILNDLRATQISPAMSALTDPGTDDSRLDLMFRERAFWLFATGSRLGDMRRLVRVYGRSSDSVFPTGAYWRGGMPYGSSTALPFPKEEKNYGAPGCTAGV